MADLRGRDLLSVSDLDAKELSQILRLTKTLKAERRGKKWRGTLSGKTLAMLFMKPSTRTRVSFDVAMHELGGHALTLSPTETQLSRGETIADTGAVLSRYVSAIVARVTSHRILVELATHASVPVINGLSDLEHPCQAISDMFTVWEKFSNLEGINISYVGDGNNVANSLILASALVGANIAVATPRGHEPSPDVLSKAKRVAERLGATVNLHTDPVKAVSGADVIYTDVWVSMGDESEAELRMKEFFPKYQVNKELLRHAAPGAIVLHCQPWHIGLEIAEDVAYGSRCMALDQAENRLHTAKSLLAVTL